VDQPLRADCPTCLGTGYAHGYYAPVCFPVQIEPRNFDLTLDMNARGAVDDVAQQGRAVLQPIPYSYDIWVNAKNDNRYVIHAIQGVVAPFDVPLIGLLELRLLPFSSALYRLLNTHPIS